MAAAHNHLHAIPSIRDVHPHLPEILGNIDINRRIEANTPINRAVLDHTKGVADALKGLRTMGTEPLVTDDIVQSAELRVRAVETAHAIALFGPVNILDMFQNVNDHLDRIAATGDNNRIISRNAHRRAPQPYIALKKTNPGHGLALALAVADNNAAQNGLHAPVQLPVLGSIPPNFNPNLPTYNHDTIYQLIIFYNDDFGILPGDTLLSRVESFRRFLAEV